MQKTELGNDAIITLRNVSKRYSTVSALNDLSLDIARGSVYGLIGPNGAGKTTLLRILATLIDPSSGEVHVDGEDVTQNSASIRRKIGYMPDFFGVYPDLTAIEYLDFYAGIHKIPRKKRTQTIHDLLELLDLFPHRDEMVETLSRGMKQRLCLARALVHDPLVLLLDEPASGLDPRGRVELRELLRSLQSIGKTVVISSHILLELAEMCSDLAILQEGRLVAAGDVEKILQGTPGSRQLEIHLLDAERVPMVIELLKDRPGMSNVVSEAGNTLLADFDGDDRTLNLIMAELFDKGIPVTSFAPRRIGGRLEEVFISITEGSSAS